MACKLQVPGNCTEVLQVMQVEKPWFERATQEHLKNLLLLHSLQVFLSGCPTFPPKNEATEGIF